MEFLTFCVSRVHIVMTNRFPFSALPGRQAQPEMAMSVWQAEREAWSARTVGWDLTAHPMVWAIPTCLHLPSIYFSLASQHPALIRPANRRKPGYTTRKRAAASRDGMTRQALPLGIGYIQPKVPWISGKFCLY